MRIGVVCYPRKLFYVALNYSPPMDLVAWERDLDELTQTRTGRGSIEFLADEML